MTLTIKNLKKSEVGELLTLQSANLKTNISDETAWSQGFLTFPYTPEEMDTMMSMPQPVAKFQEHIVAYALACSKEAALQVPLLAPAIPLAEQLLFQGKLLKDLRYYVMAQICVGDKWRGLGLFDALYGEHSRLFAEDYDVVVTEISQANARSMSAHLRVGFQLIGQYESAGTAWNVVAWDLQLKRL
jgi:hypothetical protein